MTKKYFPIKTETACQLLWTWSTLFLYNGATSSCCRVPSGSINLENFNTFHNTPEKIANRKTILNGQWPEGCNFCKSKEDISGQSERQFHLQIPDLTPPELENDLTAVNVTPRILEVYLDNVCNMSCIYCRADLSSKIYQENQRFGPFEQNGVKIVNSDVVNIDKEQLSQRFWTWLETNYQELRRIHVLGGEPFFQPQFETLLNFLESNKNPNLEFNIVTNLKVPQQRLEKYIDQLRDIVARKKIKRVDITCSIDCWGAEQEYIRYGIDLVQWQRAFEYLVRQKWITLNINQAITGLGIKTMPALINYVNQQRAIRPIQHYHMAVVNLPFLNPGIFGPGFFNSEFNDILKSMPNKSWDDTNSYNLMKTLQLQCSVSVRNTQELSRLKTYLTELDRRRSTDWKTTFPWLIKELENVV